MELNTKHLKTLTIALEKVSKGNKLTIEEQLLIQKLCKDVIENKYILLKLNLTEIKKCNAKSGGKLNEKKGGFLPLLFAGLGALGALIGGASAVANTVINKNAKDKELEEEIRHNKVIEGKGIIKKKKSIR